MAQAQLQEKPETNARSDAGAKVTVGCKMPNGLIIRGYREVTVSIPVQNTGVMRDVKEFHWSGDTEKDQMTIFGTATPFGQMPKCLIIGGFAITSDVPKDLWDQWFAANRTGELVKRGLIFAFDRAADAQDHAKAHASTRSGLEPIDATAPAKKMPGELRGIEPSTVR